MGGSGTTSARDSLTTQSLNISVYCSSVVITSIEPALKNALQDQSTLGRVGFPFFGQLSQKNVKKRPCRVALAELTAHRINTQEKK